MYEILEIYLKSYWEVLAVIAFIIFVALTWEEKEEHKAKTKKFIKKPIIVVAVLIILQFSHFFYFKHQEMTPVYLCHDYNGEGKVNISDIVSVEKVGGNSQLKITLTNGSNLIWRYESSFFRSRNNDRLSRYRFDPMDVLEFQ